MFLFELGDNDNAYTYAVLLAFGWKHLPESFQHIIYDSRAWHLISSLF